MSVFSLLFFKIYLVTMTKWWASLVAQLVKNPPAMRETPAQFLDREVPWRRARLPTPVFLGFPGGSDGEESACYAGNLGLIHGLGRYPGGGHGSPLQNSCLENPHGQKCFAGYRVGQDWETKHTWPNGESVKVKSLSCVRLFATPQTVAYQASLSTGFSRQ